MKRLDLDIEDAMERADFEHDQMMDTAAETINKCETFQEFWKIMREEHMDKKHAQNLWADHIENQYNKWAFN